MSSIFNYQTEELQNKLKLFYIRQYEIDVTIDACFSNFTLHRELMSIC